jgi:hypothetical protein
MVTLSAPFFTIAVNGIGVPIRPGVLGPAAAFRLDEFEIPPAGEVDRNVMLAGAGNQVLWAPALDVQQFALVSFTRLTAAGGMHLAIYGDLEYSLQSGYATTWN